MCANFHHNRMINKQFFSGGMVPLNILALICKIYSFLNGVTSAKSDKHLDIQFLSFFSCHLICSLFFRSSCDRSRLIDSCILEVSGYLVVFVHTRYKILSKLFTEQRKKTVSHVT